MLANVLRIVRNFVVANLWLALPVALMLELGVPDRLDVFVSSSKQVILRTGIVDDGGRVSFNRNNASIPGAARQRLKVYFNDGCDIASMAVGFDGGPSTIELLGMRVIAQGVFTRTLNARRLMEAYELVGDATCSVAADGRATLTLGSGEAYFKPKKDAMRAWHLSLGTDPRIARMMCLCEVFLLALSMLAILMKPSGCFRENLVRSSALGFLAAFFVFIVLPLQAYIGNATQFSFDCVELLGDLLPRFVCAGVFLAGLLIISYHAFDFLLHVFLLAFLIYEYIETGILSAHLPALTGDAEAFYSPVSTDALLLGGLVAAGLIAYRWVKRYTAWIAVALFVLMTASIFDVKKDRMGVATDLPYELTSKYDTVRSAVFSPTNNVIVFILDSVTAECAADVMACTTSFTKRLPGFVQYRNNIGMSNTTATALPGMVTGKLPDLAISTEEFAFDMFRDGSVPIEYAKSGIATFFSPGFTSHGFTNRRTSWSGDMGSHIKVSPFWSRSNERPNFNLAEIVRFRMTPLCLKGKIVYVTMLGIPTLTDVDSEVLVYSLLARAPVIDTLSSTFHVYHTFGTHPPITFDRDGIQLMRPNETYAGMHDQTYCVLSRLIRLLERWQDLGIYDRSFIVVCADHGCDLDRPLPRISPSDEPKRARPFLWVKPAGAHTEFDTSTLPVSQAKLYQLLLAARDRNLTREDVDAILHEENRLHVFIDRKENISRKFLIDAACTVREIK